MGQRSVLLFRLVAIAVAGCFLLVQAGNPAFLHAASQSRTWAAHAAATLIGIAFLVQAVALGRQLRSLR